MSGPVVVRDSLSDLPAEVLAWIASGSATPFNTEWERTRTDLARFAKRTDDIGLMARRALMATCRPVIPEPVHKLVDAFGDTLTAIVYTTNRADRLRRAQLLNDVLREAEAIRKDAA